MVLRDRPDQDPESPLFGFLIVEHEDAKCMRA
jgi:hypothetical protein